MLMAIVKRELYRVFTDKRLVFSAFILPALSIFLLYSFMGRMVDQEIDDIYGHRSQIKVYEAPGSFLEFWDENKSHYELEIDFKEAELKDAKEALKIGDLDLVIVFDMNFDDRVKDYDMAEVQAHISTFYNPTEEYSKNARARILSGMLEDYEMVLLTDRFGQASYATGFAVDTNNPNNEVYDPAKAAGQGFALVFPLLIGILLFAGAMGIGMDTIAGEKERGTMTALLLAPVPRKTIALGKVIGLAIISVISASMSFIAILASLPNSGDLVTGGAAMEGINFTPLMAAELLLIMLSLVAIYVGLICIMSVQAKSVKEAGTYISPIYMFVMFSAFSTMFQRGEPGLYLFALPVIGNIMGIKQLLSFELSLIEFATTFSASVITAMVLIVFITRAFSDERVMMKD